MDNKIKSSNKGQEIPAWLKELSEPPEGNKQAQQPRHAQRVVLFIALAVLMLALLIAALILVK